MSTASAVAASVNDHIDRQRAASAVEYWERVRECARPGGEPDPEAVTAWLLAAGHDPAQFQRDLDRVAARFEAADRLAAVPAVRALRDRLQAELDAAGREFDAAVTAWNDARERLWPQIQAAEATAAQGMKLRADLQRECPYPDLVARDREIGKEVVRLQDRARYLREGRDRALAKAKTALASIAGDRAPDAEERWKAVAAEHRANAARHEAEAAAADREREALDRERKALVLRMLAP